MFYQIFIKQYKATDMTFFQLGFLETNFIETKYVHFIQYNQPNPLPNLLK